MKVREVKHNNTKLVRYNKNHGIWIKDQLLFVGDDYYIGDPENPYSKAIKCRLIQVTPLGYNFLNLETSRCILKRHIYVKPKDRDTYKKEKKLFWCSSRLHIYEIAKDENLQTGEVIWRQK